MGAANAMEPQPKRRPLRAIIPYALGIASIGALIFYLWRSHLLDGIDFQTIRWNYVGIALLSEIIVFALRGMILALFAGAAGIRLRVFEWFGLSVASQVSNLMVPVSGGMMARAGYLKLRYGLPVSHFSALFAASYLIIFLVSGVSGLILILISALTAGQTVPWIAGVLLMLMATGPAVILVLPLERLPLPKEGRVMNWIHAALSGWKEIRTDTPLLAKQVIIVTLLQLMQAVSLYASLYALGIIVPFDRTLLMGVLTNLTNFVRITPGALGVRESITALAAQFVGFRAAEGLAAALVIRLVDWAIAFSAGPIFMIVLARHTQNAPAPEEAAP